MVKQVLSQQQIYPARGANNKKHTMFLVCRGSEVKQLRLLLIAHSLSFKFFFHFLSSHVHSRHFFSVLSLLSPSLSLTHPHTQTSLHIHTISPLSRSARLLFFQYITVIFLGISENSAWCSSHFCSLPRSIMFS